MPTVHYLLFSTPTLAPLLSKVIMLSLSPTLAAKCNAVLPSISWRFNQFLWYEKIILIFHVSINTTSIMYCNMKLSPILNMPFWCTHRKLNGTLMHDMSNNLQNYTDQERSSKTDFYISYKTFTSFLILSKWLQVSCGKGPYHSRDHTKWCQTCPCWRQQIGL